jgi:hypothetical protein
MKEKSNWVSVNTNKPLMGLNPRKMPRNQIEVQGITFSSPYLARIKIGGKWRKVIPNRIYRFTGEKLTLLPKTK